MEDPGVRASHLATLANIGPVAAVLESDRDSLLGRWLVAVSELPFHRARPEAAVADHIPELFDALLEALQRRVPYAPADANGESAILVAAGRHAATRFAQHLTPNQIALEFRILRQEIWRSLRDHLDSRVATRDVLAAELLINDSLDAAIQSALSRLTDWETQHQRIASELATRRDQLAAIVESSEDAILGKTLDGVITSWNTGAEQLYGYTASEAIGQSVSVIIPTEQADELESILEQVRQGHRVQTYETLRVRKDGSLVEVLMSVSPIRDDAGKVVGASAIARDIGERNALARERETFFAAVTHDLKNPLSAIQGMVQLLRRSARLGEVSGEQLVTRVEAIERVTRRLAALLDQLGDVLRLREGRELVLQRHRSDLVTLVQRVVAEHQAASTAHQIVAEINVSELIGEWDESRLERVLDNLLGNATKFSPAGGPIGVVLSRDDGQARLEIHDQGLGIPAADLPHIFDWFRRGRNVANLIAGTGVGLAAARQMIELHGGTITAESEEGNGSTFTVCLPLSDPRA